VTKTLRVLVCGLLTLLAVRLATAQTASSGTIQGHVVKQSGGTLRALIALRPAAGGAVHQGVTGVDGAFVFASVSFSTPTTPCLLFRPPNRRHEFFQECCLAHADHAASLG